jgi:hypothetical protein
MLTRTLVLGFCALGYPAQLEHLGFISPIVGIRVVACGGHRWGMGVGSPVPMVPVFGHPIVAVSELVDGLVCALRGFLGLVMLAVKPLGLVSFLVDHALKLFELAQFIMVICKVTVLAYLIFTILELLVLVLNSSVFICLVSAFLSSFPVHPGIGSVVCKLFELSYFVFGHSVVLFKPLVCVLVVHVIVVLALVLAVIGFVLIGLVVV